MDKKCYVCKEVKSLSEFYRNRSKKDGYKLECKACCKTPATKYSKAYYRKNKDTWTEISSNYRELFEKQSGVCAICSQPESITSKDGSVRRLAVDHCHKTGTIRGLLCSSCNVALGQFKDSTDSLARAIEYLKRFKV